MVKVVGGVLGAAVLGVVLVVGWFVAAFSGGVDDLLDFDHPQPGDADVVAAEAAAYDEVERGGDEVVATLADLGLRELGGGQVRQPCAIGRHDFKIDDDYDLSCSLSEVRVLEDPVTPASVDSVVALDAALRAAGWRRVSPTDLEQDLGPDTGGWVDVPPLRYDRTVDGRSWGLVVDEARGTSIGYQLGRGGDVRLSQGEGEVSLESLVAQTSPTGYGLAAAVSVEYYRD